MFPMSIKHLTQNVFYVLILPHLHMLSKMHIYKYASDRQFYQSYSEY